MLRYIIGLAKKSPRFLLVLILTFDLDILSSTAIDILSGAMQIIFDQDIHLLIIYYIWPTRTLLVFKKFSPQNFPKLAHVMIHTILTLHVSFFRFCTAILPL